MTEKYKDRREGGNDRSYQVLSNQHVLSVGYSLSDFRSHFPEGLCLRSPLERLILKAFRMIHLSNYFNTIWQKAVCSVVLWMHLVNSTLQLGWASFTAACIYKETRFKQEVMVHFALQHSANLYQFLVHSVGCSNMHACFLESYDISV